MGQQLSIVKSKPLTITKSEPSGPQVVGPNGQRMSVDDYKKQSVKDQLRAEANRVWNWENAPEAARKAAPMILAGAGAAVAPPVAGAVIGAMGGQVLKDVRDQMPTSERVTNALLSGAGAALTEGAGQALQAAGPALKRVGASLWERAAKIPESVAKKTQTMRAGGTLPEAKREIADTVLSRGRGTIGQSNLEALKADLDTLDTALDQVISGSKGYVDRATLQQALVDKAQAIGYGTITQEAQQEALSKAFDLLDKAPARMTLKEANQRKREIYKAYEKSYAADAATSAAAQADKTTARAIREEVANQAPEAAAINTEMSRLIPATAAMEKAASRVSNHDVLSLTKTLAAAVPNPRTIAAALANDPFVASFTAQQIYKVAKALPKNGRTAANIVRLLKATSAYDAVGKD